MKTYITGISGTGKTAIAKELNKSGIKCISIDETPGLCKWRNKTSNKFVDYDAELNDEFITAHDWVCDTHKLMSLIENEKTVVVAGIASNQKEYLKLFDKVLLLQCSSETFLNRIMQRTDNDFGKDESAQKVILGWYNDFEAEMLKMGAKSIDVEKPLQEVVDDVISNTK